MSEFEALLAQGWTLIDPDGNVWQHPRPKFKRCVCGLAQHYPSKCKCRQPVPEQRNG